MSKIGNCFINFKKIESLEIEDDDFVAREDVMQQKLAKLNKTAGNLDDILEESQRNTFLTKNRY